MNKTNILIIGAGQAGLGAAYQVAKRKIATVTVIEQEKDVGGIAGSFNISGINVDYGSHRLHPACDPEILGDLKTLLGNELMERPRHGRIRLRNRWIHFPLKPIDLAIKLPFSFSLNTFIDLVRNNLRFRQKTSEIESFATILEKGLGKTICSEFYFPYGRKIWGMSPEEISPIQANRRVSANSLRKMLQKILASVPGFRRPGSGIFFYPRKGFGQITNQLYDTATKAGANFYLGASVKSLQTSGSIIETISFCNSDGKILTHQPDYIFSTIPLPNLVQLIQPQVPLSVIEAAKNIEYRAMILVYLLLEKSQFSEYDAHYFPEADIPLTRISEPKNYNDSQEPRNLTVLCAELPCSTNDPVWKMTDAKLGEKVCDCLESVSIPIKSPLKEVVTCRLTHAYPIYKKGYEIYFNQIDHWLGKVKNLVSFGRQGLFVHDNIHHSLNMAYAAVDCISREGRFNRNKWEGYKQVFKNHVVED